MHSDDKIKLKSIKREQTNVFESSLLVCFVSMTKKKITKIKVVSELIMILKYILHTTTEELMLQQNDS